MMRQLIRSLIRSAFLVLGPLLLFDGIIALFAWYFRIPKAAFMAPQLARMRLTYLMLCSGVYGVGRVLTTHPIFTPPYRHWLTTTPWRRGLPLPMGEVSLTLSDAATLGLFVAVAAFYIHVPFWLPLLPFLAGYVTVITVALARSGERQIPAVLWAGLAVAVVIYPDLLGVLFVLLVLLPLTWWNWWQSQLQFPWGLTGKPQIKAEMAGSWARIGPQEPPAPIPLARSLTLSFLLALTLFALLHHLKLTAGDAAATICLSALAGMLLSAIRGLIYTAVYHSPISLRGRIWTLRPIIPGYDYVLIAPLAMVITSIALPLALLAMGSPPDLAFALAAFAVILIGLAAPPTRFHWQLTGSHSISLAKVDAIELLDPASHPGRSVRLAGPQGARS